MRHPRPSAAGREVRRRADPERAGRAGSRLTQVGRPAQERPAAGRGRGSCAGVPAPARLPGLRCPRGPPAIGAGERALILAFRPAPTDGARRSSGPPSDNIALLPRESPWPPESRGGETAVRALRSDGHPDPSIEERTVEGSGTNVVRKDGGSVESVDVRGPSSPGLRGRRRTPRHLRRHHAERRAGHGQGSSTASSPSTSRSCAPKVIRPDAPSCGRPPPPVGARRHDGRT